MPGVPIERAGRCAAIHLPTVKVEPMLQVPRLSQALYLFSIGDILGELSGPLFPWTAEEQQAVEAGSIKELSYICPLNPGSIAARQFLAQPAL